MSASQNALKKAVNQHSRLTTALRLALTCFLHQKSTSRYFMIPNPLIMRIEKLLDNTDNSSHVIMT